ncbi:hydrocephalus-inducing protein homolog isoform X2 [Vidua macroura]|uniref:hydrocephalus-inducing protein homolog isoform X2 n=1 Tax=Vidua macroura TaxID=187451 RepID=UPI0023A8F3BA|nr:hydrocephalus-inducing protein homolog isoform X2 [Vidua macroura]
MASGFPKKTPSPRLLLRERLKPETLTPSAFQEEMSLSSKQRLARAKKLSLPQIVQPQDKRESSHQKLSAADPEKSSFQPCPPEVVFQNYTPGEVYEVPVVLRNRDKVPHLMKVTLESSPYFQLVGPNDVCRKVPPGLSTTVHVLFSPWQNKDYFHQLLCTTEREGFIVPIRAIGARAILDFPDQLDFSKCPVKYSSQKTLVVRNVGNRAAHYQLSTQSPFSVLPAMGVLGVGDTMEVTVGFQPLKTGDCSASLVVHYDTGEDTHTSLHGRAVDAPIRLDRNTVTFDKTYITVSNRTAVLIHNRSNITARFQWKAVDAGEEEDQLELSLQSEMAKVRGDPMLFSDDIFSLEPKEGEIGPNCSAEISVSFKPQEARVYERAVYCDISGRQNRLPLLLTGEGLGPRLHSYFEELNIGEVSLRVTHRYKAALLNKGPIGAPFSLIPPSTAMGSCFTFLPQEGIVAPHGFQLIRISFCPTMLGEFEEEFCFRVTESPKPVTLTIRGSVTGPTFHFDVPALHFGDVSFGFPHTLKCCLYNTSLVHMAFNLHIPGDGLGGPSIDISDKIPNPSSQCWRKEAQGLSRPREFTISPCSGTVRALGSEDIKVTLCSNTAGEYKRELVLDVEDVGKKVLALPLTARCIVPPLRVLDPVVSFRHCYLEVPYEKKLTLVNDSDFPGCYCVLPQENKEEAATWYCTSMATGIIEARGSVQIPIVLRARLLGECDVTAELAVLGRGGSPLEIHLECVGQGPVVYVYPREINFGVIPVLKDRTKTFYLANQCDIPATFQAKMAGKRSCWRLEPSEGVVPPNTEVVVRVIAHLSDTLKFQGEVKVSIENSTTTIISLRAVGKGTTIAMDESLTSGINLKSQFSFTPCYFHFKMTNTGRRIHRLYWSTEGFGTFRPRTRPPALGGTKRKAASQIPRPGSPVFKVQPLQVELRPGQTVEMVLEGCSSTAQEVKERLLCHARVGSVKEQIVQVDVTCKFICPVVQMSSRAITFRVEKKPSDVLTLQYQPLSLKNTCSLPFSIVLDLEQPFLICSADQQPLPADSKPMTLDVGEELHLCIQFNPAYENSLHSRVAERVLRIRFTEHPHEEQITVRGEVHFPNLHLETKAVDFGCIMNDTEEMLFMRMTNCGPLPVRYHWSFLTDRQLNPIRFIPSPPKFKPRSSKNEGVFPRRYSKIESVKEPTKIQVFSVRPSWCVLEPGERELVIFTFFGHANIMARVKALCHVEGGPTYEVLVTGQASYPSYQLDVEEIDWGLQVFNKVLKAEVTLQNTGVLEFTYVVPNSSTDTAANPLPGVPVVVPRTGSIAPGKKQVLEVYYLPGKLGVFCKTVQVQVASLDPAEIFLKGEGTSPGVTKDLPSMLKEEEEVVQEEEENPEEEERERDESVVLESRMESRMESLIVTAEQQ